MGQSFKVQHAADGRCVRDFLQGEIPAAPQAYLNQLLKKGKVLLTGKAVSGEHLLCAGDSLELPDSARLKEFIKLSRQQPAPPVILFETAEFLIADKPAGLAVHASSGHETTNLTALLQQLAEQDGAKYRISPVQRLDLETSGVILFGKGRKALAELGQLMMNRQLKKTYLALVVGEYRGPEELVTEVRAKGKTKAARCHVKVLQSCEAASLLEIDLLTGRQHQIRQQLAEQGHPLFGDRRYRGPCPAELKRVFLHSFKLFFHSPFGGEPVSVTAPLPAELNNFWDRLERSTNK